MVGEFEQSIKNAKKLRFDRAHLELSLDVAAKQDYNSRFELVKTEINKLAQNLAQANEQTKLNIGVLYNPSSISIKNDNCTESLIEHSSHAV